MAESKEVFKTKLIEFFERHDPEKVHLAPKIADEFHGKEKQVYSHLSKHYARKEARFIKDDQLLSLVGKPHEGAEPV